MEKGDKDSVKELSPLEKVQELTSWVTDNYIGDRKRFLLNALSEADDYLQINGNTAGNVTKFTKGTRDYNPMAYGGYRDALRKKKGEEGTLEMPKELHVTEKPDSEESPSPLKTIREVAWWVDNEHPDKERNLLIILEVAEKYLEKNGNSEESYHTFLRNLEIFNPGGYEDYKRILKAKEEKPKEVERFKNEGVELIKGELYAMRGPNNEKYNICYLRNGIYQIGLKQVDAIPGGYIIIRDIPRKGSSVTRYVKDGHKSLLLTDEEKEKVRETVRKNIYINGKINWKYIQTLVDESTSTSCFWMYGGTGGNINDGGSFQRMQYMNTIKKIITDSKELFPEVFSKINFALTIIGETRERETGSNETTERERGILKMIQENENVSLKDIKTYYEKYSTGKSFEEEWSEYLTVDNRPGRDYDGF